MVILITCLLHVVHVVASGVENLFKSRETEVQNK